METPVLVTKLYVPPPPPHVVPRPRLLERLDAGLAPHCRLTLLSAPAGFGKTTLLGEWIAHHTERRSETRFAWVSLDEGDGDPARFLGYVVAALQGFHADVGADALLLHGGKASSDEPALTVLVNDLARMPGETVLVLDDYHVIEAKQVHDIVAFLVDHVPPHLHLVVATRFDPPLPLARLRSRGGLVEVRAADLRFTSEEAGDFLNEVMGLRLSADDIAALEVRTEGWIAGLQLAAVSMRGRDDVSNFIDAFAGSHRFVLDYLAEEVLQQQSDEIRGFLLQTSVLERMTGPLCDAITGKNEGGGRVLESLERANLFVVPLDDRREWYRYHHLFAEVLQSRLRHETPDLVPGLHNAASQWFEQHDLPDEAVRHALAAGDVERAATLVEMALPAIRRERQDSTLLGWLDRIPDNVVRRRPVLSAFYAWRALVAGDLEAVESWLREAEQVLATTAHLPTEGEELSRLPMTIAIYRAALAQAQGNLAATTEHARRAYELAGPDDHLPRAGAAGYLGLASYAQGDLETAVRIFPETLSSLHAAGDTATELSSTVVLADMWIARGRLVEARQLYERALRAVTPRPDQVTAATADLHVGFSELLRQLGDLDAARHHLRISGDLGERASLIENRYRWFVAMALVRQAEGDVEGALALLDEAEPLYRRGFLPEVRPIAAMKARIMVAHDQVPAALNWARDRGLSATDELSYLQEYEHLTLARLLLAQYRLGRKPAPMHEALELLSRLEEAAEAAGRLATVNEILVLQALAHEAQGDRTQALATLERVLVATEPEGHVRLFLDEGLPMEALLRAADLPRVAPSRVTLLLAEARDAAASPQHALVDPLSDRELEVLRLLHTPMSVPEIARELFVSPNTLRTHTRHIFTKLEVNNRRAAVHRAAELGLI
jgi:LuxR family maltose regulon positive regulatory protein